MRQLDGITITRDDRPAPPSRGRRAPAAKAKAPAEARGGFVFKPPTIKLPFIGAREPRQAAAPAAKAPPPRRRVAPTWWRRSRPFAIAFAALVVIGAPVAWSVHTGLAGRIGRSFQDHTANAAAGAGLKLATVTFMGNHHDGDAALMTVMGVHRGDPMVGLDLPAMRERLAANPWVRDVTIERRLPTELHVTIAERVPVAIWQSQGKYFLIDDKGQTIGSDLTGFGTLKLVVGDGAPQRVTQLLAMLATEPALAPRVKAAQWIGDRRWTLQFDQASGGIEVRLPDDQPELAWHQLAKLDRDSQILERKLVVIDMRLPDRYVLRQQPAPAPAVPAGKTQPKRKGGTEA